MEIKSSGRLANRYLFQEQVMALAVLDSVLGRYVKQLHESMNPSMENNNVLKLTLCVALSS